MITYSVVTFAMLALGGVFLAEHALRDKFAPRLASAPPAGLCFVGFILVIAILPERAASQIVPNNFSFLLARHFLLRDQLQPLWREANPFLCAVFGFAASAVGKWLFGRLGYDRGVRSGTT